MIKQFVRRTLTFLAPETMASIQSARARAHSHTLLRQWGVHGVNKRLVERYGYEVQGGPFQGMLLTPKCAEEQLGPYLLGTYEFELHDWIERLKGTRYGQILDIGAKFGYYAVGLARSHPDTPVIAFDPDWWAREAVDEVCRANRVTNVTTERFCSPAWLRQKLSVNTLIVSDCEGYEGVLFARTDVANYSSATILVELHGDIINLREVLSSKFSATHSVETAVPSADPPPYEIDLSFLPASDIRSAIGEIRGDQSWLLLTPNKI